MRTQLLISASLLALLAACGGGGGGGSDPVVPPPVVEETFLTIVPAADMTWTTTRDTTLTLSLKNPDGSAADGAAVRVFTLTHLGPDGSTLADGASVPVALVDSAATDASGNLVLPLHLAGEQTELLIVATRDDTKVQSVVALGSAPTLTLTLGF